MTAQGSHDDRKHFLIKLVSPRPTFPADMTPAERATMLEHVAYWTGKLADGSMIAFGPVADPGGVWGLGLLCVRDEAEVSALTAGDPVIRAGGGFRYDVLLMPRLVH